MPSPPISMWLAYTSVIVLSILCLLTTASLYEYQDNVERSMSIMSSFLRYMGTLQLSDQDVERYKLLMPYFDISSRADVLLSELAKHIDEAHHLNAVSNCHTVLKLLQLYCGVTVQREQMWVLLGTGLLQNSQPIGRGLTGMQDSTRSTDSGLLQSLFTTTSSIAVNNNRVDQNLLLKCYSSDKEHPNLAERLQQLRVDVWHHNLQTDDQVLIRSVQHNCHLHVLRTKLYLHQHEHTTFTMNKVKKTAGSQPWQHNGHFMLSVTGTTGKNTQYLAVDQNKQLTVSTQGSSNIRLWRTVEGVYYMDTSQYPCHFLTVDNSSQPWTVHVTAVDTYPPSTLAHWHITATITRIYAL